MGPCRPANDRSRADLSNAPSAIKIGQILTKWQRFKVWATGQPRHGFFAHNIGTHTNKHTKYNAKLSHTLTHSTTHSPHILTQSLAQPLLHPHIHSRTVFGAIFEDDGGRIWTQAGLQTTDLDETFQTHQAPSKSAKY